jgi:hypothetical protein
MIKHAEKIVSIIQDYHCDLENATALRHVPQGMS